VAALVSTEGLTTFYGDFQALFGIDFEIHAGEIVAVIGANGAGKSTFLKTLMGLLPARGGSVWFEGCDLAGLPAFRRVEKGMAMVPEGRRLFPSLSVRENLLIGAHARRKGPWTLERVFRLFPALMERRDVIATALSGGQQQMAAIGRALMANPRLLICDELSLGLSPRVIGEIYEAIGDVVAEGMTLILVEQDVAMAKRSSHRLYCFQEGRISLSGASATLSMEAISTSYFGL
jgi:branched-chain amino acid transport system ATP-binding protein